MKIKLLKYISVLLIYFVIDVSYQMLFGIPMSQSIQETAGIQGIFATEIAKPSLILVWFLLMTLAIVKLAVNPALEARSVKKAAKNALLLGLTAYGTLGMANGWSLKDYPLSLVAEIILEGALFAPISASITTWWLLKQS